MFNSRMSIVILIDLYKSGIDILTSFWEISASFICLHDYFHCETHYLLLRYFHQVNRVVCTFFFSILYLSIVICRNISLLVYLFANYQTILEGFVLTKVDFGTKRLIHWISFKIFSKSSICWFFYFLFSL